MNNITDGKFSFLTNFRNIIEKLNGWRNKIYPQKHIFLELHAHLSIYIQSSYENDLNTNIWRILTLTGRGRGHI